MATQEKHVSFDEERLVEVIEIKRDSEAPQQTRSGGQKGLWMLLSFCLGVVLAGYGVKQCAHHVSPHFRQKYVHLVAAVQAFEIPKIKANIYVPAPKAVNVPQSVSLGKRSQHAGDVEKRAETAETAENAENADVCTTETCLSYAQTIRTNLAKNYTKLDPCQDFSTYACDGFKQANDYRPDQASVSIGSLMGDAIRNTLRTILENPYPTNTTVPADVKAIDQENFNKMKTSYDACMNETAIKLYGVEPVRKLLAEFEKVYPAQAPAGVNSKDELTKAITWLEKRNIGSVVGIGVTVRKRKKVDDKNPDVNVVQLGSGSYGLPSKEYWNNSKITTNYKKMITQLEYVLKTGEILSWEQVANFTATDFAPRAERIAELEAKLARASPDPELGSKVEYYYNIVSIEEMEKLVPAISMTEFISAQIPSNYTLKQVINSDPWFFGNLTSILAGTSRETMHEFLRLKVIASAMGRVHKDYRRPAIAFSNSLAGRQPDAIAERWRTCVSDTDGGLGWLLSAAFVERAFSTEAKTLGDRIVTEIKAEFDSRLKNLPWMSEQVKEVAAKKVMNIVQKIGYSAKSPNIRDPADLKKWYSKVEITNDYYQNGENLSKFANDQSWADLAKPVDRDRWGMTMPTVNAYYSPSGNEIVFPAGIMQLPVFSEKLPEYVSYGAFGAVAGHELTHGFDDNGRKYNEKGVYANWWDNSTIGNFQKKTDCFVEQFGKYSVEGLDGKRLKVNGILTLGENIADSGGLTASYSAWDRRDKQAPERNLRIKGLEEFTPQQMFFVSYANWWCGKTRKEQLVNQVLTDPHSPTETRILGTLSNTRAFKEAFNCPVKEPTCELW